MDKKYIELFKQLTKVTAVTAETVMEYNRQKKDDKGLAAAATTMRNDFQNLSDKINDDYVMNKEDLTKLLVGAIIIANQLNDQIESRKKALVGYREDIIPKLQKIMDEASTDEEIATMANNSFVIKKDN